MPLILSPTSLHLVVIRVGYPGSNSLLIKTANTQFVCTRYWYNDNYYASVGGAPEAYGSHPVCSQVGPTSSHTWKGQRIVEYLSCAHGMLRLLDVTLSQEIWTLGNFDAVAIFPRALGHYLLCSNAATIFPKKIECYLEILMLLTWQRLLITSHKQFRRILEGGAPSFSF